MLSTMIGSSRPMTAATIGTIPPTGDTRTAAGNDPGPDDPRRRARHVQIRQEARRILIDFREAERDRRRPEFRRPRPVRVWR
jgi:hypothetical protein